MIVALGSVRGSPGVSVWSMLLAAAWPTESDAERVVVEVDIDGGVAGARYGVGVEPGVLGLVTGLRHGGDVTEALQEVGRKLASGAWLVRGWCPVRSRPKLLVGSGRPTGRRALPRRRWRGIVIACGSVISVVSAQPTQHQCSLRRRRGRCCSRGMRRRTSCRYPIE